MLSILENELRRVSQMEKDVNNTIKESPRGSFRCSSNRGYYQYYQGDKYLSKKKIGYIKKLAQKDYCIKMREKIKVLKQNIKNLIISYHEIEEVYHKLTPGRKVLVTPLIKPIEDIIKEFEAIEHQGKEFNEEDTREYYTSKGERVRSKSEKIIADELYRNEIPYKYELPIEFIDNRGRKVKVYPDFTVLNKRTGEKCLLN